MRRYISKAGQSVLLSALLLAVGLECIAVAQNRPSSNAAAAQAEQQYLISEVHVQLGALRAWENLVKTEMLPALNTVGVSQSVWRTATLGEGGEFWIARPIKDVADLDEPNALVRALGQKAAEALMAKAMQFTLTSRTFIVTTRPELSIAPASGYVPRLAGMTRTSVTPGRTAEYEKRIKEQLAVINKTNVKGVLVSRVGGGGDPNQYNTLMLFDSFADVNQLGPAWRKAAGDANPAPQPAGVVAHVERIMLRYVPELSIQASAQKTAK